MSSDDGLAPATPLQKQELSVVAVAVLSAGGRLGAAVGHVFRHLRIDNGLDIAYARQYRRIVLDRGGPTAGNNAWSSKQDLVGLLEMLLHVHDLLQPICLPQRTDLAEGFS